MGRKYLQAVKYAPRFSNVKDYERIKQICALLDIGKYPPESKSFISSFSETLSDNGQKDALALMVG